MGEHNLQVKSNLFPWSSMWINPTFNALQFIEPHLPFLKYFLEDYKAISSMNAKKLFDLMENHLINGLLMARAEHEVLTLNFQGIYRQGLGDNEDPGQGE